MGRIEQSIINLNKEQKDFGERRKIQQKDFGERKAPSYTFLSL